MPHRAHRPPIQGGPHVGASAPESAVAAPGAPVTLQGGHADQCRQPLAAHGAARGQGAQQRPGPERSKAWDTPEPCCPLAPPRTAPQRRLEIVEAPAALIAPGAMGRAIRRETWGRAPEAILCGRPHRDARPPPRQAGTQVLWLPVGDRARCGAAPLGTVGQGAGRECIRCRSWPCRLGTMTDLTRMDPHHGARRRRARRNKGVLGAPCGCEHNPRGLHGLELGHEGDDPRVILGDRLACSRGTEGNGSWGVGHIKTDKNLGRHPHSGLARPGRIRAVSPRTPVRALGGEGRDAPRSAPVSRTHAVAV
jgi:hypothetical protein